MIFTLITQALAIGENCAAPKTRWDKAYCEIASQPEKFQTGCYPQRAFPSNANNYGNVTNVKGLVVLYHGYTACPDAFEGIVQELTKQGYVTVTPLLPGQGIKLGYGCATPGVCLQPLGTNPSFLPVDKKGYTDFVDWSLDMVREEVAQIPASAKEPNFFVGSIGLSAGGPLTTVASSRPDTPISKAIVINPFYSITYTPLDFKVESCKTAADPQKCVLSQTIPTTSMINSTDTTPKDQVDRIGSLGQLLQVIRQTSTQVKDFLVEETLGEFISQKYDVFMTSIWASLTTIAENPTLMANQATNNPFGWGEKCSQNKARNGICEFRIKNLLALQSFAHYSLSQIDKIPTSTKFAVIHSDVDGPARDAVSTAVVSQLQSRGIIASKCRYELKCPIDKIDFSNNLCGVPHSSFSRIEASFAPPNQMYWEKDLYSNIMNYMNGVTASVGFTGQNVGDFCAPASNTAGFGPLFDNMGPRYLMNAKSMFQ